MNSPRWKWLYGRFRESGVFRSDIGTEFHTDEKRRFVRWLRETVRLAGTIFSIWGSWLSFPVGFKCVARTVLC